MRNAQEKRRARQDHRDRARVAQCGETRVIDALQVVRRHGTQLAGQLRGADLCQLVRMYLGPQSGRRRPLEHPPGLVNGERTAVAEHVAEACEPTLRDFRQKRLAGDSLEVFVRAAVKIVRDGVGAEVSGFEVDRAVGG